MKVVVFSMSLNGEYSSTLCATRYIADAFKKQGDEFTEIIMSKDGKVKPEELKRIGEAELVVFATSMYHFIIASQAMEAMGTIGEFIKKNFPNKPVTCFMTSNYLMDPLVRQYIESWAKTYDAVYFKGFNMHMDDILDDDKRSDAYAWFYATKLLAQGNVLKADESINVSIILADNNDKTKDLAEKYKAEFEGRNAVVKCINIMDYTIKPCLGCQYCYTHRKCFMEETDDFVKALREVNTGADVILTVGELNNGYYSAEYKCFFDRHVCFGRCPYPYDPETVTLYAYYKGNKYNENDYRIIDTWADAMGSFGGEVYLGTVEDFDVNAVQAVIANINAGCGTYDNMYRQYITKQFAELALVIQNVEPLDYECFKQRGCYEPPAKNENCRAINDMDGAKKCVEMKSFAVRAYRNQVDSKYEKKARRVHKNEDILTAIQNPWYANKENNEKPKKKGFGIFKKG